MKARYKRQVFMGSIGDMKALEYHFERMAEKGWMLEKLGVFTHRYCAAEPCSMRFYVDLLPQITAFDYPENEDAQDYRQICRESGWTFVGANKQFHVFCANGAEAQPVPIHTDNAVQAQIFLRACRKYELFPFLLAILMFMYVLFTQASGGIAEIALSNMRTFQMLGWAVFMIGYVWIFGHVMLWYFRTRRAAKRGTPMPAESYRRVRVRGTVFTACILALLPFFVIGLALEVAGGMSATFLLVVLMPASAAGVGLLIRRQIDTKRRTRGANIRMFVAAIVLMEVAFLCIMGFAIRNIMSTPIIEDELDGRPALTLADIGVSTEPSYVTTRVKGSVAVPVNYEYSESNRQGGVTVQVYSAIHKALARKLYDHLMKDFDKSHLLELYEKTYLSGSDAAAWGAEEGVAIFAHDNNFVQILLIKDKSLLSLIYSAENLDIEASQNRTKELMERVSNGGT